MIYRTPKNFAIFDKSKPKTAPTRRSPRKSLGLEFKANSKENNVKKNTNKKSLDNDQMIIDAGQKLVDPVKKAIDDEQNKTQFIAQEGKF